MRRRRKTRYTWLPNFGTQSGETGTDHDSGREFQVAVNADGTSDVIISPLTFDAPVEGDFLAAPFTPLGEVLGNEYFIKRIVGKLHAGFIPNQAEDGDPSHPNSAVLGCGFFIARANDDSAGGGSDTPIGSASITERQEHYSPLSEDVIREPWIWRRTWVLGNAATRQRLFANFAAGAQGSTAGFYYFPSSTAEYGSIQDGPHIDAKTARRVKQDERLFFVVAARSLPIGNINNAGAVIEGRLDFRILGALRKARQGSAF